MVVLSTRQNRGRRACNECPRRQSRRTVNTKIGLLGVSPLHDLENICRDLFRANQHERHPVPGPARRSAKPEAVDRWVLGTRPEQGQLIQPVRQAEHCAPSQVVPGAGRTGTRESCCLLSGDGSGVRVCAWKLQAGNAVMFDTRQCRIKPFFPKPFFNSLCVIPAVLMGQVVVAVTHTHTPSTERLDH